MDWKSSGTPINVSSFFYFSNVPRKASSDVDSIAKNKVFRDALVVSAFQFLRYSLPLASSIESLLSIKNKLPFSRFHGSFLKPVH